MPNGGLTAGPAPERGGAYDYDGVIRFEYSPELDRDADPGEIVWTWVAYEEDSSVGKDRPVAVVGRADGSRLAVLMLSSRDHDDDRGWISIGRGPWDREGRESWVRRDRVLAVAPDAVRREGSVIPRATYEAIIAGMTGAQSELTMGSVSSGATATATGTTGRERRGAWDRIRSVLRVDRTAGGR